MSDARTALSAMDLPGILPGLGFREADAADFVAGLAQLGADDWRAVDLDLGRIRGRIGDVGNRESPVGDETVPHPVGTDFLLLIALVAAAPDVHRELVRRGLSDAQAGRTVFDLGQQVHIHRLVHGRFGFGGRPWTPVNFNGSHLWLGRLQYTLENDPVHGWTLGVHIPEAGPLTPAAVQESLLLADDLGRAAYPEHPTTGFICTSWLLDPGVGARLPEGSNIAAFAARFSLHGDPRPGRRDALYFGFHEETRDGAVVDPETLPQDSALQRAIVAQLREPEGVTVSSGWLPFPQA